MAAGRRHSQHVSDRLRMRAENRHNPVPVMMVMAFSNCARRRARVDLDRAVGCLVPHGRLAGSRRLWRPEKSLSIGCTPEWRTP